MLVILAIQEAEIRRIKEDQPSPKQIVHETLSQKEKKKLTKKGCRSVQVVEHLPTKCEA
jgi:hypothetical protein